MSYRLSVKRVVLLSALLIISAELVVGCAEGLTEVSRPTAEAAQPSVEAENVTLTVFAAASLTDAFTEIGRAFEAANPGVTTVFNFAGSNQLATQINEGAPVDLFASANLAQMEVVVESGMVDANAPVVFVTNRLIVVFPADNPGNIENLHGLAKPDTLLVLAAEEVPVGRYSLGFLDKASADPEYGESFRADVLANVMSYEENVRGVLNKVALGEADAGIVYSSDLDGVEGVDSLEIPDELNVLVEYPIAALNDNANASVAAAFIDFILSEGGQAILESYGFGPATPQ